MEFRHLNTFLMVAKQLSFYKAAQALHYAQSSVSAQVMALEDELGVKLFDRLGRRILLTDPADSRMERDTHQSIDASPPGLFSLLIIDTAMCYH